MALLFRPRGLQQQLISAVRCQRFTPATATCLTGTSPSSGPENSNLVSYGSCLLCQFRLASTSARGRQSQALQNNQSLRAQRQCRLASTKASASQLTPESISNSTLVSRAPDITDHYTIFPNTLPSGPPPHSPFEIPVTQLRREFLQLQNLVHPDKYPAGAAKQHAEALSARINEAYRTLTDPLTRAQYLLREYHGVDVTAEDGAAKHALDPETLLEVMEVQETIEEVANSPGAEESIAQLKRENDSRIAECVRALGEAFDRGDIEGARKETVRLRFWYSVGQGLKEWEPGMAEIRLVH
ncbi:hypothetical protein MPDQ_005188 [Monascus purpureus]|uniref:J domain-containing protein n=1 Tax=Monascus purpureus TaxID=5098 RepID=A0A507QIY8_MONPU|nr:hypothetical protein MPDQ_005188 [Monascus purpureus]BDD57840.1 hypothetical protein MAP00_003168 [Monascus purpureus]